MRALRIFLFEGKHFVRNPFKIIAFLLFIAAGIYGLHNGVSLYSSQQQEIDKIKDKIVKDRQGVIHYYQKEKVGPKNRPWVNYTEPFWAIWSSNVYLFKNPSPAMVYSIGQAEQYGFYKKVTFMSTPYDADMAEEIANPERLQNGTLDFSFVVLFLLPLVLLTLTYNIKAYENELGFLPLILTQSGSQNIWLLSRFFFYLLLVFAAILAMLLYGAILTNVFSSSNGVFIAMVFLCLAYLILWGVIYVFILLRGKSILGNTLSMVGVYLLFTFIIPAAIHQWISIEKPTNLMTDFIDATRDKKQELYDLSDEEAQKRIFKLFPDLKDTEVAKDTLRNIGAMNDSYSALINQMMKESIVPIQKESEEKNYMIQSTYWFNPVVYFQNQFNKKAETHYQDYLDYKKDIQVIIDKQIDILVKDTYTNVEVDENTYLNYIKQISNDQ